MNFNESIIYRTALLKKATFILKDKNDAEDIVQETYIRAYNAWNTYKFNGATRKTWMFTILLNLIKNKLNYDKLREKISVNRISKDIALYRKLNVIPSKGLLPHEVLEVKNKKEIVFDILKKLSEKQNNVMLLYIEGYEYREIADKLKIPIGTVKSSLYRARKEIKKRLKKR